MNLKGKKAVVFGTANERSLAWAIAEQLHKEGAEIALTYQNERLERRVKPLGESIQAKLVEQCDVGNPADLDRFFAKCSDTFGSFDILIHSIAFANTADLEGRFIDTKLDGFQTALSVSAYSLVELARRSEPFFEKAGGGRIITLSYYGAVKVIPNYNVMGVAKAALEACTRYLAYDLGSKKITVNAISAGPVKTLAAAGIKNFRTMLDQAEQKTPLHENISSEDVGHMAAFLCGPGGAHVTGATLYVDSGAHAMGA